MSHQSLVTLRRCAPLVIAAALATSCSLVPNTQPAPPASDSDFKPLIPAQQGDPFAEGALAEVETPTKFKPQLTFEFGSLKAGETPGVTLSVYQTKGELEVRESQTLVENASFRFDKLEVGKSVGYGKMEVGTPPKLTLDIAITVTATNQKDSATLSVKASSPLANVYVADLQIRQVAEGLSIISIGNATRANDANGVSTNIASARVIQSLYPGFVQLPAAPGQMRTRTVIVSEPDPGTQVAGQRVFRPEFTIE